LLTAHNPGVATSALFDDHSGFLISFGNNTEKNLFAFKPAGD
jgi:hypothetical protein